MTGWSNWQAPLFKDETKKAKYFDIPLRGMFDVLSPMPVNGLWQVEYAGKVGYIEDRFFENYVSTLPTNCVDLSGLQTENPNDAQQYIFRDGRIRYNMCGEICAAYIMGIPLDEVLIRWKAKSPTLYQRLFGAGSDKGTGPEDLIDLFGAFGYVSTKLQMVKYTPRLFGELVQSKRGVIVSCHLNKQTGVLNGGGVLHWVVVKEVVIDRMDMGYVIVYNPFGNAEELYSWREFLATTRAPYGVIV